jgi:hypothetical protein
MQVNETRSRCQWPCEAHLRILEDVAMREGWAYCVGGGPRYHHASLVAMALRRIGRPAHVREIAQEVASLGCRLHTNTIWP